VRFGLDVGGKFELAILDHDINDCLTYTVQHFDATGWITGKEYVL